MTHIEQQYKKFKDKHGYIPKYFDVYNAIEVKGLCFNPSKGRFIRCHRSGTDIRGEEVKIIPFVGGYKATPRPITIGACLLAGYDRGRASYGFMYVLEIDDGNNPNTSEPNARRDYTNHQGSKPTSELCEPR